MLFNFDLSTVYAKRASNNRPQHFKVKVNFYLLRVQYPWCHCFLCLSAAVEKSTFRSSSPRLPALSVFLIVFIELMSLNYTQELVDVLNL